MKRLLLILFSMACLGLQGQVVSSSTWFAPAVNLAERTYLDVLNDGNTEARYIAHADYITIVTGVSVWADSTANGKDLLEANTSYQAAFAGDSIIFTNDQLKLDPFAVSQPITIYAVMAQTSWTSEDEILWLKDSDGNVMMQQLVGTPSINLTTTGGISNSDLVLSTLSIVRVVINTTSSKVQVNEETAATGDGSTRTMTMLQLGDNSYCAEMYIKEVIVRSVDDSDSDEMLIVDFLNAKYTVY